MSELDLEQYQKDYSSIYKMNKPYSKNKIDYDSTINLYEAQKKMKKLY